MLAPARPREAGKAAPGPAGGAGEAQGSDLGDLQIQSIGNEGKIMIFDDSTLAAQQGLLNDMIGVLEVYLE